MADIVPTEVYLFGSFELDVPAGELRRKGVRIELVGHPFEVLVYLVRQRKRVVSNKELFAAVWRGTAQEALDASLWDTLAMNLVEIEISRIRAALDDDAKNPTFVRTIRGRGRKFIAPVHPSVLERGDISREAEVALKVANAQLTRRTGPSIRLARKAFERAMAREPDRFEGHAGIAKCVTIGCHVAFAVFPLEDLTVARTAAEAALKFARDDKQRAEALCITAHIHLIYDWDLASAQNLLNEVRTLDNTLPLLHQMLAHLNLVKGNWSDVQSEITAAWDHDSGSPMLHSTIGLLLYFMRKNEQAIREGRLAIEHHEDFAPGHIILGLAYESNREFNRAIEHFDRGLKLEETATALAALGHAYAKSGKPARARAILKKLDRLKRNRPVSSYFYALIHAGLGESEVALGYLTKAVAERCDWLIHAGVEPRWDDLRSRKRFQQLLKQVGIADLAPKRSDLS